MSQLDPLYQIGRLYNWRWFMLTASFHPEARDFQKLFLFKVHTSQKFSKILQAVFTYILHLSLLKF
jgi:hypothetical protein